ncbi:YbaK/EbsC family protein [Candidatus Bipolaricaulota bacterium]|nr:YbaK/EbsC family protein [Candidatus Bipolaricaulota bacterium]
MPVQKLKAFLDEHEARYVVIQHSPGYSAQEVAAYAHIPGKELAKTVMVKLDGKMAMAVVPASHRVDLDRLREAAGASEITLSSEAEFRGLFPNCDLGAMPPFGNLWSMPVYVSAALAEDLEIAFSAGSHSEVVRLSYEDYGRLVEPTVASFSTKALPGPPREPNLHVE